MQAVNSEVVAETKGISHTKILQNHQTFILGKKKPFNIYLKKKIKIHYVSMFYDFIIFSDFSSPL